MLKCFLFILLLVSANTIHAQDLRKMLRKSWIKTEIENLSGEPIPPDTLYTRYTFTGDNVFFSYYPAWDNYTLPWSLEGRNLTISISTYILEELTDSTLVYSQAGFRRFKLISEQKYASQCKVDTTNPLNGETVYKASKCLTPRFKNNKSLASTITDKIGERFSVNRKATFLASFIVTSKGKIENVQILQGIMEGYDEEFIKQIRKTSGNWIPAKIDNKPVNSELVFETRYLHPLNSPYSN